MVSVAAPREVSLSSPAALAEALLHDRAPLYALLDAARDPAVLPCLRASGEPFESLYAGRRGRQLAEVAPYLTLVSAGSPILEAMARAGWGRSWGFFLVAPAPLAEVRRHLRRFLTVEDEEGEALTFRFYDPRVLRPFLAAATDGERRAFFGPITTFLVEDRDVGDGSACAALLSFERGGEAVAAPAPPWDLPRIRDAQHAAFSQALVDDFVDRAARRLDGALRRRAAPPVDAPALVVDGIAAAARRGIDTPAEIDRDLAVLAALGPGFDERLPWARAILARADLAAPHKLHRLERWLRRHRTEGARA